MNRTTLSMIAAALLLGVWWLSSYRPDATMPMYQQEAKPEPISTNANDRFKVERVGVFKDDLAYGLRRGIYVITDAKTGKELVGVSGIGIAEVGSHQSGKHQTSDER